MVFSHVVWLKTAFGIPVPESAAAHWFTWALGAIAVEAMFGLVKLPNWTRSLRLAALLIVPASFISAYLPVISKDTPLHDVAWFLIHPLWGVGFFIVVNRIVVSEQSWLRQFRLPSLISIFATLGIFSYSIYLTHELMIMQSWRWTNPAYLQLLNVFLVIVPATIVFAWVFFWYFEKPFMVRRGIVAAPAKASTSQVVKLIKEGLPSRAFLTTLRTRLSARLRSGSHTSKPDTDSATTPLAQPPASPTPTPIVLPSPTVKIDAYRASAGRIIGAALTKNRAWERLDYLTDHIGHRLSGSRNLERAIGWAVVKMKETVSITCAPKR